MSRDTIIFAERLGKRYAIGTGSSGGYAKLSDAVVSAAKAPLKWLTSRGAERGDERNKSPDFWALEDLNFEIKKGEVLGIIGRNGAGKSTLLKILSRITEPTTGRITLRGRVASLLEVGTGFHPELTGRENIYLNGAILGMSRAEIAEKFDEIVAFAEVERFLDTPVKRYSSGMYVRLAFAVAAHLEPEILIVDEVLAVGDAQFQQKCLGKLKDVASDHQRTILFVSHNLSAMRQLTSRCLVLKHGHLDFDGSPSDAIAHHLGDQSDVADVSQLPRLPGCCGGARFEELRFCNEPAVFAGDDSLTFETLIAWERAVSEARISMTIFTQEGSPVGSGFSSACLGAVNACKSKFAISIPAFHLAPGRYHCTIALGMKSASAPVNMDAVSEVLFFEVIAAKPDGRTPTEWQATWGALQLPALEIEPLS